MREERRTKEIMEAYKSWVRRNQKFIHFLESLANGITWLLRARFSKSEIGPEAVYALLRITSDVNQYIIDTAASPTTSMGSGGSSSVPWALCFSALRNLETVVEVAAEHFFADGGKWNFIAATEATKALVRLGMLRDSGWKMLLKGGGTVNSKKAEVVEKRTFSSIWFEKGLSSQLLLTGEVLSIMRPLLYVLLIRKYGIRSWFPWVVSLAVDLNGMSFLSFATNPKHAGKESCCQLSSNEKKEIKRRNRRLGLYLMQDPFFTLYTKNILEKSDKSFGQIPGARWLIAKGVRLLIGAQTRFTYTLGS